MKFNIATTLLAIVASCDASDSGFTGLESFKRSLTDADEFPHSEKFPHTGSCRGMLLDRVPIQQAGVGPEYKKAHPKSSYNIDSELGTTAAKCHNGKAGAYPCKNIDLLSVLTLAELNFGDDAVDGTDLWGWHKNGREFALMGIETGTVFVEITNPVEPVIVGKLATKTKSSWWRDIKTIGSYALIVSEAKDHGMQVFDLERLLTAEPNTVFSEDTHYSRFGNAHNIFINEETKIAYAVGTNTCRGGLHMIEVSNPKNPKEVGCYSNDGYTHDVQCVVYKGSDKSYRGKEICFASNEDTVSILNVDNKKNIQLLSKQSYDYRYTHQGWLTEDHNAFIFNDELDEIKGRFNTRTHVVDVKDLSNPRYVGYHNGRTKAIDHNLYVKGNYIHQANYRAGYNLLEIDDAKNAKFKEKGFFDIYPSSDSANFNGAWSTFPYFPSGNVIVSGIEQGLFVLNPNIGGGNTSAPTKVDTPAPSESPGDDMCDGLDRKPCRKFEKDGIRICNYSGKKNAFEECKPRWKFANSCDFSFKGQCNRGSDACEWINGTCKHVCTDLSKNECKNEMINGMQACRPAYISNPCRGCHLKTKCP